MERLARKVCIVTGANSGIGRRTACLFAQEGATVVLVARRAEKLNAAKAECEAFGGRVLAVPADISRRADCRRIMDETVRAFGRIDVLVNCAGISDKHLSITKTDTELWDKVIATDQTGLFYMMQEVLPHMQAQGAGSIVNISSIGGTSHCAGIAYTAAKSAVIGMSINVAIQFAGSGIRCNVVAPGPTPTELFLPENMVGFDAEFADLCDKHMDATLPQATTDDQAQAILFFASDDSKGCTGQVLVVDNGMTL